MGEAEAIARVKKYLMPDQMNFTDAKFRSAGTKTDTIRRTLYLVISQESLGVNMWNFRRKTINAGI